MTTKSSPALAAEAMMLDPRKIAVHPMNPRENTDPDEGMVASVKEHGVLERLLLAPVPEDLPEPARKQLKRGTEFLLLAGHRRRGAAVAAKLKTVPVDVRHDLDTTEKQLGAIAAENIHRADLTVLEEGDLYLALGDLGLNQAQISQRTSVAKPRVSERTRVAKLPEPARRMLATHQVTLDAALTLAKVEPDEQARIAEEPTYLWDQEVRRVLAVKERQREDAATRKALEADGVKVLDDFPPTPDTEWIRLEELLDDAYDGIYKAVAAHNGWDPDEDNDDWSLDEVGAWHKDTCTGHAVVQVEQPGRYGAGPYTEWIAICTTPDAHDDLLPKDETGQGRLAGTSGPVPEGATYHTYYHRGGTADEDEDENGEDEAPREALAAAAEHRRAWLRDLLADTDRAGGAVWRICRAVADPDRKGMHNHELALVLGPQLSQPQAAAVVVLQVLDGLGFPDTAHVPQSPSEAVATWADHAHQASPAPRLALATIIAGHASREDYLSSNVLEYRNNSGYGYCLPWVRALDAMGYPWTGQELEWLGRTDAEEQDADDEEQDAEDFVDVDGSEVG